MAETKIEWADFTFNPWIGCTKVSAACDYCYAEAWANRFGHPELWQGERRRTSASYWQKPFKWDWDAAAAGRRSRIFPSLCDPFDNQVPSRWRDDFWHRIDQTPHLDWLLLTKRPQNIPKMLPDPRTGVKPWGDGWPNVWLGTTCENQPVWDRNVEALGAVPAVVHFVSVEPMLGPIDLHLPDDDECYCDPDARAFFGATLPGNLAVSHAKPCPHANRVDWIVVGGESGPGARPFRIEWARSIIRQCKAAGTAVFCKQLGATPIIEDVPPFNGGFPDGTHFGNRTGIRELNGLQVLLRDRKGGDIEEWSEDLRVREYPAGMTM